MCASSHRRRPWPNWAIEVLEDGIAIARQATRHMDKALDELERGRALNAAFSMARARREIAELYGSLREARKSKGPEEDEEG